MPCAYNQIMTLLYFLEQTRDIRGIVLAIGIHEYDDFTAGRSRSCFDSCTISFAVGMMDYTSTCMLSNLPRLVGGAIIHDNHLGLRKSGQDTAYRISDAEGFVLGW